MQQTESYYSGALTRQRQQAKLPLEEELESEQQPEANKSKKVVKKVKQKKKAASPQEVPSVTKKQKMEPMGESIEEEQDDNLEDSGFQSNMGESIYEDFDNE